MTAQQKAGLCRTIVALGMLAFTTTASAQLIQPFDQLRLIYGQAMVMDGEEVSDTGLIEIPAPDGFFGFWTDTAAGAANIPGSGGMSFTASMAGGWDGADTISIPLGGCQGTLGGGGPPSCSGSAVLGQIFQISFTIPQDVSYSLSYSIGGNSLADQGIVFYLQKDGELEPIRQDVIFPPGGNSVMENLTGNLSAGDYVINVDARCEAAFTNGGGGGGGDGLSFSFQVFEIPTTGDMNCDGRLDVDDIAPFALALIDADAYLAQFPDCDINRADSNFDIQIDGADVDPFVQLILPN